MRKIVRVCLSVAMVLLCGLCVFGLTACGSYVDFQDKLDRYEFAEYDSSIENLEVVKLANSSFSICSTQVFDNGIYIGTTDIVLDFVDDVSDIFLHPMIEDGSYEMDDDRTHMVLSSTDFDPQAFAVLDECYVNPELNALYLVLKSSLQHQEMYEYCFPNEDGSFVSEKSKATYTVLSMYPEDLEQYDHVYITVRP